MKSPVSFAGAFAQNIAVAAFVLVCGVTGASAVTYNYAGQNYNTPNPNADPTDFGTHMIASITLNCSPCSGTYFFNNAAVTSIQLSTGPYTAPAGALATYASSNFVTITGGTITAWHIFSLDYPSSYAPAPGVPWGQQVNLTVNNDPSFYGVGDNHSTFLGAQSASNSVAGTWSLDSVASVPLPSALPLFASGLGALGLFGWRRKKRLKALAA